MAPDIMGRGFGPVSPWPVTPCAVSPCAVSPCPVSPRHVVKGVEGETTGKTQVHPDPMATWLTGGSGGGKSLLAAAPADNGRARMSTREDLVR